LRRLIAQFQEQRQYSACEKLPQNSETLKTQDVVGISEPSVRMDAEMEQHSFMKITSTKLKLPYSHFHDGKNRSGENEPDVPRKKKKVRRPRCGWKRPDNQQRFAAAKCSAKEKSVPPEFQPEPQYCFQVTCPPKAGEWLDEHNEKGQTFAAFQRQSMRCQPHGNVNVIELVPLGPFQGGVSPNLEALQRYTSAFFCCKCRISKLIEIKEISENARCGENGQLQICCNTIFDILQKNRPARDVLCRVAVTMVDLYPIKNGEAWNFVFGQAHAMDGVGVFSFARYQPDGSFVIPWIGEISGGNYDVANVSASSQQAGDKSDPSLLLFRCCKVLTHETGHLFGIRHCIYYECLLNGCNHLEEFDKRPLFLCPVDLRKLQNTSKFSVVERYTRLLHLSNEFGFHDNAQWLQARINYLSESAQPSL